MGKTSMENINKINTENISKQKENEKTAVKKFVKTNKYDKDFMIVYSDKIEIYKIDVYGCMINFTSRNIKENDNINEQRLNKLGFKEF